MRTRVRTVSTNRRREYVRTLQKYNNSTGEIILPNPTQVVVVSNNVSPCLYESSTITDQITPGRNTKRIRSTRRRRFNSNPCTHTKTKVIFNPGYTGSTMTIELQGVSGSVRNVWTFQQKSPNAYALSQLSNTLTSNGFYTNSGGAYTTGAYWNIDWFALNQRFLDACDTFIPMNTLLGETIIEGSIFTDLLKIAINPTRGIGKFIELVKDIGMHKKTLGKISKSLKAASGGILGYSFGVRPALQDLGNMINANREIGKRFNYLISHRGGFVPVRARQIIPSDISNNPFPTSGNIQLIKHCKSKESIGTISAMGKVRTDLYYNELWKLYLQYFGIDRILGLAWELIPFSFVIDWFTNAQERLTYLTRFDSGSPYTEFQSLSYGWKQKLVETVYLYNGIDTNLSASIVSPTEPVALFDIEKSTYNRYLTCPSTSGVVDVSSLGSFHAILGGSLLLQRALR